MADRHDDTVAIPERTWQSHPNPASWSRRFALKTLTKPGPNRPVRGPIKQSCTIKMMRFSTLGDLFLRKAALLAAALIWGGTVHLEVASAQAEPTDGPDTARVVVTIKPLHSLVSKVLDGVTQPKLLISGAQSPHVFALKPSDARALHSADTFIRVGESVEPFTKKLTATLPKTVSVLTLTELAGLHKLSVRSNADFEAHDHRHAHHDHHDEPDHDQHGHAGHHRDEQQFDPHIWLDPKNAAVIVQAVGAHFSKRLPQHQARITQNVRASLSELKALEADLSTMLAPVKDQPFLVFHDAFQYFENRFGLRGVGAITVHPEAPPSAKRMIEIRQKLRTLNVRCVFAEPQFSKKRLANIVEGTPAKVGTLDPIGTDITAGIGAYQHILQALADSFQSCLAQRDQ